MSDISFTSPELMIDRKQDFVLYAVDPIESFRASQRPAESANGAASTTASTSTNGGGTLGAKADTKGKQKAASSFVVGKGFFTWALAESGDGQSLVHGRIRDEYAEEDESDDSEEEDDETFQGKVLEVSLRLKAASSTSRDQFIDRVKVFQSSTSRNAPAIGDSPPEEIIQHEEAKNVKPHSASSPVTAIEREQVKVNTAMTSTPAQQQLLQFLQALQAQAASATSPNDSTVPPAEQTAPQSVQQSIPQQHSFAVATETANDNSPGGMAHLLRSLTAASPSANFNASADRTAQPTSTSTLSGRTVIGSFPTPRSSTTKFTKSPLPESAASPILGGLTPGYEAGYLSRPSPTADIKASVPTVKLDEADANDALDDVSVSNDGAGGHRSLSMNRSNQCCYNCGIRSQRSWRHLHLDDNESIRFKEGSAAIDHGKKVYRSCNACGLYYNKYGGISRPEHVWKEAQRLKREQLKESEKMLLANRSLLDERMNSSAEENQVHSQLLARNKQIARTLSEACERDTSRRMSTFGEGESDQETTGGSAPARRAANMKDARLKDFVLDSAGVWRTKRSILENPENKRPGRPKGSKLGQARGRRRRTKQQQQTETQDDANERRAMTASSPGANSTMVKSELRDAQAAAQSLLAQSSPVRTSSSHHLAKTPGSAVSRAKYGAASYLLDSSPATAFQTVLNEAETDWHALCGLSPRRSPRKNPHGTQSGLNPYATVATTSPTSKARTMDTLSALDLMKMTSSSPLTRSRVKSGHYQLDEAWTFSSEGLDFGTKQAAASSSITSPGSPSPSPAHLKNRGVKRKSEPEVMLQPGQRTIKRATSIGRNSVHLEAPQSTEKARKAARQARHATSVGGGSANVIDAGPFMGLDIAEAISIQEEDEFEEAGGGSPTLGRSRRMRNKSDQEAQPSPITGEGILNFTEDWTRSTSMRELFPTPSPVKQWNMNSPSNGLWQSPTSWALASSTVKIEEEQVDNRPQQANALMEIDVNQQQEQKQLVRRKPLPATVEDAPSSVNSATSSPIDEEDESDEIKGGNLMDLFEDPYGLLAASGIGVQGNQPSLSMEDFESIELFKGVDFGQQLDFFTQMGSNGVAAHLAPTNQGNSSTLKIEGKGKAVAAITPNAATANATTDDFNALLKDPGMQAILAHMQLSPSKAQ
jgi:hypothetical protein